MENKSKDNQMASKLNVQAQIMLKSMKFMPMVITKLV